MVGGRRQHETGMASQDQRIHNGAASDNEMAERWRDEQGREGSDDGRKVGNRNRQDGDDNEIHDGEMGDVYDSELIDMAEHRVVVRERWDAAAAEARDRGCWHNRTIRKGSDDGSWKQSEIKWVSRDRRRHRQRSPYAGTTRILTTGRTLDDDVDVEIPNHWLSIRWPVT